jgi:hypothetical protein
LTPDDIAEVVVFAAGRRENVVVADTLIFPNHQVSFGLFFLFSFIPPLCFFAFQSLILNGKGRCYGHAQKDLRERIHSSAAFV